MFSPPGLKGPSCPPTPHYQQPRMKYFGASVVFLAILFALTMEQSAGQFNPCTTSYNNSYIPAPIPHWDERLLQLAMNLEFLEAEFFMHSAFGYGLDTVRPDLASGGPPPRGTQRANLDEYTRNVTAQFAYQEIGHLRALKATLLSDAIPRPLLDISSSTWSVIFDRAMGGRLSPPFNVYSNSINFLLACYVIPYVGLTGYVGANQQAQSTTAKRLIAGLLGVESGQDAVIRAYLSQHANTRVSPYEFTVAEVTSRLSVLRNSLEHVSGVDDEGIEVPVCLGAEEMTRWNILAGDSFSVSYARTAEQVLSIVYGTGNPSCPGSFFPFGAEGEIAGRYLADGCH